MPQPAATHTQVGAVTNAPTYDMMHKLCPIKANAKSALSVSPFAKAVINRMSIVARKKQFREQMLPFHCLLVCVSGFGKEFIRRRPRLFGIVDAIVMNEIGRI